MSKRALIIGINQFATVSPLRGCVNDTLAIKDLLSRYYGFEDIKILTDAEAKAAAIKDHLENWLFSDYAGDGSDVRLFHFSSHGTQVPDQGDDEWECKDEVIVPYDHDWGDPFRDDDLRAIFDQVPENVSFTFIADCCHSGSIQRAVLDDDVEFSPRFIPPPDEMTRQIEENIAKRDAAAESYISENLVAELLALPEGERATRMQETVKKLLDSYRDNRYQMTSVDRHVLLAACQDKQTAADAHIDDDYRGAFTWSLTQAINGANGDLTLAELISNAGNAIRRYEQIPQLECPDHLRDRKFLASLA